MNTPVEYVPMAMAGLAEAAFAQELLICWGLLFVVGLLLALAWILRSWKVATIAAMLAGAFGLLFTPWDWFFYVMPYNDPDLVDWRGRFRAVGAIWLLAFIASLASIPLTRRFQQAQAAECDHPVR